MSGNGRTARSRGKGLAGAFLAGLAVAFGGGLAAVADDLTETAWRAVAVDGVAVPDGVRVVLRFGADGELTGTTGCNRAFGGYERDGERISVGPLGGTRMACPPPADEVEWKVLAALEAAARLERPAAERLEILDETGRARLVLEPTTDE